MVSIWRTRSQPRTRQSVSFFEWLATAQLALGWAIILLMLAIAGGIFLAQVSRTALAGRNAQILNEQIRTMETQNSVLRQQIAAAQSLQSLDDRSAELGLVFIPTDPQEAESLTVVVPTLVDGAADAALPLTLPVDAFEQAVWLWLQEQAPFLKGLTDE